MRVERKQVTARMRIHVSVIFFWWAEYRASVRHWGTHSSKKRVKLMGHVVTEETFWFVVGGSFQFNHGHDF